VCLLTVVKENAGPRIGSLSCVEYRRPLSGEPLALDLVNTAWAENGAWRDVLADRAGHERWLRENDLTGPVGPAARRALLQARDAIKATLERPGPTSFARLDDILERGRLRVRAGKSGAREELEVASEWRVPWLAARNLLRLLDEHPERIRPCANSDCVLWFLDTTRSGTRRWCSMSACGNRIKARRHYRRRHAD
jgi:predicted RNA-binding Zn ribbon-like protein